MGVYNDIEITTQDITQKFTSAANYLDSLPGITAEVVTFQVSSDSYTGVRYSFDETDVVCTYACKSSDNHWRYHEVKNGDAVLATGSNWSNNNVSIKIYSYVDDNCTFIYILETNTYSLNTTLVSINSTKLIGYGTSMDVSTLTFEDIDDSIRIPYHYSNMFPYAAPPGQLDFIAQGYFVNGNSVKKFTSTLLKECSTVNILSTASLPYPLGNHLAIGAHCLVPLDAEEEGGGE